MKILRVITSMNPKAGGPCQGIRNSIPALKKLGIHNEVVCLDDSKSEYLGKDDFIIHALSQSKGPWAHSKDLIPWLKANIKKFDAVIVHGLWQFHSYAVYKVFKELKPENTKYYVMPHGMLDPYFQKAPERRLKAMRNWVFWKLIEAKVINNANGVLFTCQEELVLARETFTPYKPKKELNVGYGIQEPPNFNSKIVDSFKEKYKRPYFLFLSRIHQKKGLDLLVKAYKTYADQSISNASLDLVVAGPGLDTEYGKEILDFVENNNLKSNIHFPGMLTGDAKWGAFHGAEAFILPSHQENFGIAVVEALACNKPVLISNQVNIWSEIKSSEAGLVEDDTIEGAFNLIKKYSDLSLEERNTMKSNARACFEKFFAIDPAAKKLLEAISN